MQGMSVLGTEARHRWLLEFEGADDRDGASDPVR